ncbi:MAG: glutamate-5-semialdehyde dehydrogenase [Faecalicoccus sp.]|nr:glutamate-5-semialdehyde dehydrogenase [Faecalicoccus sp.]
MNIKEEVKKMKLSAPVLASSSGAKRNEALAAIQKILTDHKDEIFEANQKDVEAADQNGVSSAVKKRLVFNEAKLKDCISGIDQLIRLEDPVGKIDLARELDDGLKLYRISCPIGVIGVIFEARPDALVQISSLCIKSGNCAILKGGKETALTNKILFTLIKEAFVSVGLPSDCLLQAEAHSEINELLECEKEVDLLIPRGSNQFVSYIMNNTKIPVMGHADGICHIYVDKDADLEKAIPVLIDAKTQYTAACNAVETVLVHQDIAAKFLPVFKKAMDENKVKIRGSRLVKEYIDCEVMEDDDFDTEYLDLIVSVQIVKDIYQAIEHINYFGSHHTDAILTEDKKAADLFCQMVDSAGVYVNASTRFADGFRYGFGAEVGISTGKIHARGPVGLEGLVTYKYRIDGNGDIVGGYASGKKSFKHKDLEISKI